MLWNVTKRVIRFIPFWMKYLLWVTLILSVFLTAGADHPKATAAIIGCKGMINEGLYESIRRRTEMALNAGADYLIYEIDTDGGFLETEDEISKYLIFTIGNKARTVAYVKGNAITAGTLISLSCRDVIMRENTILGPCSPFMVNGKLEGVEREKAESFVRATFMRAAEANGYPEVLLKAMVTMQIKVYRVKNLQTDDYEFFESDELPKDLNQYDLDNKDLIVNDTELLRLTAYEAKLYGIARAVVKDRTEAISFLAERDGVAFGDVVSYGQIEAEPAQKYHKDLIGKLKLILNPIVLVPVIIFVGYVIYQRIREYKKDLADARTQRQRVRSLNSGILSGFFSFKRMLTTFFIKALFILIVIICLAIPANQLISLLENPGIRVSTWDVVRIFLPYIIIIVVARIILEGWMVMYRINETLTDILEVLKKRDENH